MKLGEYSEWVRRGGGKAELLSNTGCESFNHINGLLLTGGEDVDPTLYGEPNRHSKRVNPARDNLELWGLNFALERKIPILGICRGMQLLTVALGGKLYQDLSERDCCLPKDSETVCHRGTDHTDVMHGVRICPNTILSSSLDKSVLLVNSHHHQGIKELPYSLRASATAPDGLIEAFEGKGSQWILGLQWHPERWPDSSSDSIIRDFVAACGL